jgi:ssDNA thymidine ADP-ribosyltransferase, DarT
LENGLFCRNSEDCDPDYYNIGYKNLIDKRGSRIVPVEPGGVLNDYVPFYFAPRSPMLYSIHTGFVQGFTGSQSGKS